MVVRNELLLNVVVVHNRVIGNWFCEGCRDRRLMQVINNGYRICSNNRRPRISAASNPEEINKHHPRISAAPFPQVRRILENKFIFREWVLRVRVESMIFHKASASSLKKGNISIPTRQITFDNDNIYIPHLLRSSLRRRKRSIPYGIVYKEI